MKTKEEIYDELIAPILLQAATIAAEHDIDLVACVDIADDKDPYGYAATRSINMATAQASMRLVNMASLAKGNVDSLILNLVSDQKGKPHNSTVLSLLEKMG